MKYLIAPGHSVDRATYVIYLRACAAAWRRLGHAEQADRVSAKAAQVEAGDDDVSRRALAAQLEVR